MEVSFLLTGRDAVADSPTCGQHAHASVQSGHDRVPAGGMPTVSQPYGGRMSPSHPVDARGTLPKPGSLPRTVNKSDVSPRRTGNLLAPSLAVLVGQRCREVKRDGTAGLVG
jgi:hypothetical protein